MITLTSNLEEIGVHVQAGIRANALAAWELGRCLKLAKAKAKRKFGKWCEQYLPELSERTIQRYMRVAELAKEDVEGTALADVYKALEGEKGKGKGKTSNAKNSKPIEPITLDTSEVTIVKPQLPS